jgi:MSHA biogenesis protein MshJ
MNKTFRQGADKWITLTTRERILILVTIVILPLVVIYIWLIEPALLSMKDTPSQRAVLEKSINSQQQVLDLLKNKDAIDPNIAARKELKRLRSELSTQNEDIRRAATNLVSPDQMLLMLRDVLSSGSTISLVSARSLDVETMELGDPQLENSAKIYVHPFEVVLEGSYQGLYDYLNRIEQLEGVFFWDTLDYTVGEYPTAEIKIKVHTLSSVAGWLGA